MSTQSTQTAQRVKELLKNIDVYELMLAEIEDYATWLLNDIMNECREYASEKSRGNEEYFNIYNNECLYESREYFKKNFIDHVNEVYDSAKTLLGAFTTFSHEKDQQLLMKVNNILQDSLKKLYPYEILM